MAPELTAFGAPASRIEDRHRRLIGEHAGPGEDGRQLALIERLQRMRAAKLSITHIFRRVRTDCVVGIERDSLSGTKSLASEVPHGRDNRPLVGARARRMRVRGPAFGPALAQTHRAYGGRDRG